uniref:Uncharacterized protein n=1 Tax=Macaca fascicularis TaxID=9541 RepID=A0A7N9CSM7_MACFA
MGVRDPLEEEVCPLSEVKRHAGRTTALFRAVRQGRLILQKLHPQLSLPPGAPSKGDEGFIYESLTGAAEFCSDMPTEVESREAVSLAELQWALPSSSFPAVCLHCEHKTAYSSLSNGRHPSPLPTSSIPQ